MYGIGRSSHVRAIADVRPRWLIGLYSGTLVCGGAGFSVAHILLGLALGEAMQLHALVNLASAVLFACWAVVASTGLSPNTRFGAVTLAIPAALTTLFLLFTGLVYFQYADYALPFVRMLVELLPITV